MLYILSATFFNAVSCVAVGFHFPECYTPIPAQSAMRWLRLAFIFQSAIHPFLRALSCRSCGWLSFSRVLYKTLYKERHLIVAVGFHFPECYTSGHLPPKHMQLRLAFIFQSAILNKLTGGASIGCGWLSFSRVLYVKDFTSFLDGVAVGFHFPECYTIHKLTPLTVKLRLAFIFQSAIPTRCI